MRGVLTTALLLIGCGPVVTNPCVDVERTVILDDLRSPSDVVVRDDGVIGVLTTGALLEFDEHGTQLGIHQLVVSGNGPLRAQKLYADAKNRWWLTGTGLPRDDGWFHHWIVRIDPDGAIEAKQPSPQGDIGLYQIIDVGPA